MRVLLLGIGNTCLTDDGVGVFAVRRARELLEPGEEIHIEEAELAGFALLDLLEGFDAVVVLDAVKLPDRRVGELVHRTIEDFRPTSHLVAAHQIDLPTAVALGRKMGQKMPHEIHIVGVVVSDDRTLGEGCTPEVDQAVDPAARLALRIARAFLQ